MNTPFLLLGAAILFWGWQSGHWPVAIVCALLFEAARFVPRRWEFTPERLNRIGDFCTVLVALLGVYLYFTAGNPRAIIALFLWLPLAVLPLALAQAYGTQRDIELAVLFWSMRRQKPRIPTRFNIGYLYFAAWIIAASAANRRDGSFELGLIALAAWALWRVRPRSYSVASWLLLVPLAGVIGYLGHNGLRSTQQWIEINAPDWIRGDGGSDTDPYRADTDIGRIGALKQSERIVLRVRSTARLERPLLLHRASYDSYTGLRWLARNASFKPVEQSARPGTWLLAPPTGSKSDLSSVVIVEQSRHPHPVLSLPAGTRRIEDFAASELKRNTLGAVQAEVRPGFIPYRVLFAGDETTAAAPGVSDLAVPAREAETLKRLSAELGLKDMAPRAALAAVERHFSEHFRYSLFRRGMEGRFSAIADFLERTHAGHCEYFASATVLLLRAAGIPARYATGFLVQEWSPLENAYLVRERHAHAWARAWVDGAWRDLDTTPATWMVEEAGASTPWTQLADRWSWLRLTFAELQARQDNVPLGWIAIGAALLVWISWRLFGRPAHKTGDAIASDAIAPDRPGTDSAFYRIEAHLGARGWERAQRETLSEWLARIGPQLAKSPVRAELVELLQLHYRYRFDPVGLAPEERADFAARVEAWLASTR